MSPTGIGTIPGFRSGDYSAILCHPIAQGTQTIAVEHRTGHPPIGERDRRRTVPGGYHRGVELEKRTDILIHVLHLLIGFGHQHEHRVERIAPGMDQ